MQCYLAGPMQEDETWRDEAKRELLGMNVNVVTPMFLEEYVDKFDVSVPNAGKILTCRDRIFASESDFVLANFDGATSRSMGTCIELGWADNGTTITVGVIPPGNPHIHPIVLNVCNFVVQTLQDGLDIIAALSWRNS